MRIAIIGSEMLKMDILGFIPLEITELVSGGLKGIESMAEEYADRRGLPKLIIKPEYGRYGRHALIERNKLIVECADMLVAIWDGRSKGTKWAAEYARELGKAVRFVTVWEA